MKKLIVPKIPLSILLMWLAGACVLCADDLSAVEAADAQADEFLTRAEGFLAAGAVESSRSLLASAIEISPGYSEALFLRARIELAERAGTRAAIADLREALTRDRWSRTDPHQARSLLAQTLLRTGMLPEAKILLEAMWAAHPEDDRTPVLLARLYARMGDLAAERKILDQASLLFPLVDDSRLLSADLMVYWGKKSIARELIATGIKVHPDSLPLMLAAALLEPDVKKRLDAVDLYVQKGGQDPLAATVALEAKPKDAAKYLKIFIDQKGLARQDLTDRAAGAVQKSKDLLDALAKELAGFSGMRDLDADRDGFWEERWAFQDGKPVQWIRDLDQDGVPELSVDFSNGQASLLSYYPEYDLRMTLKYSRYPYVEAASEYEMAAGGAFPSRTYSLVPYALKCAFLEPVGKIKPVPGLSPRPSARPRLSTRTQIQQASFLIQDIGPEGKGVKKRMELSKGLVAYSEEDANLDGVFEHRLWYTDGVPIRGARDMYGTGTFNATETWRSGTLVERAVDTDRNGKVDFRELFGEQPARLWDYDEDGIMDSRERPGKGDTSIRDFSTAMNGSFDMSVVFRAGRIVQVTRNGKPVRTTPDAARGIVWIGTEPAASLHVDASMREGYHFLGGKEYLAFRNEGVLYIEEMR